MRRLLGIDTKNMLLVAITALITITSYDLLRNISALLLEGKPVEFWLLNTLRVFYAQAPIFNALMMIFVAISFWFIIYSCLHLTEQLLRKRRVNNQHTQAKQSNPSPWKVADISWLILGSLMIMLTSLLLYLPFVRGFPGGDTPFYVGSMQELENHGVLWSLFSQKRPLVSLIFLVLYSVVPKPNYLTGVTLTITSYILLSSLILSWFSLLLLRRLGVGKFSSLLCVFAGYVIQIFRYCGDLYANYLAYALMFVFVYFYINVLEGKKWDGVLCGIILSLMFFIHEQTAYITVVIATLSFFLQFGYIMKKWRTIRLPIILWFITTCVVLLPFLSFALTDPNYLGIFSTIFGPVEERYGGFATTYTLLTQKISPDNWNIRTSRVLLSGFPNIIGYCLVLFGIILTCLSFRKRCFRSAWILLQSWTFVLLAGITIGSLPILTGTPHALSTYVWRLLLLMPTPLLLVPLVNLASTFSQPLRIRVISRMRYIACIRIGKDDLRLIKTGILITVAILSLNVAIQYKSYYSDSPRPSISTIEDALAIRRIFGYGNRSVILYIQSNDGRKVEWISALTGMRVFYGRSILNLYLGIVDDELSNDVVYKAWTRLLEKARLFGNVSGVRIITAETFAVLDPIESGLISESIPNPGGTQIRIFKEVKKEYAQMLYELQTQLYDVNVILGQSVNGESDFWNVYRGGGGKHNAIIVKGEAPTEAYKITLMGQGSYFIRLYHIFETPMNFTPDQYLRLIIYCNLKNSESKRFMLSLGSDVIAGGASLARGDYTFTCVSGKKSCVLVPLRGLKLEGEFNLSATKQLILYLDRDDVIGEVVISEITLIAIGPSDR